MGSRCLTAKTSFSEQTFRPQGYKTFLMFNSVEHEIFNAHKYKKNKEIRGGGGG